MTFAWDLALVETTMLAVVRVVAFLIVAPPFHVSSFPGTVKMALALGITLAAGPRIAAAAEQVPGALIDGGVMVFVGALAMQALVGFALGFLIRMAFAAVQTAGSLIDLFGGFQMASSYDPISGSDGAVFSRFYSMAALALLFASDGHQLVLTGLTRSFDVLPLGTTPSLEAFATLLTGGLADLMVAALLIAGPLIVVLFLADVGLGLLTRVAPALNAFALGFPLKIMLTLSLGSVAFLALPQVVARLTENGVGLLMEGAGA